MRQDADLNPQDGVDGDNSYLHYRGEGVSASGQGLRLSITGLNVHPQMVISKVLCLRSGMEEAVPAMAPRSPPLRAKDLGITLLVCLVNSLVNIASETPKHREIARRSTA